jgi:hypothetical protein
LDHAAHQRRSTVHGESQARTARSARGQDGAGGTAACSPPLSAAGFRLRCHVVVVRWVISEPGGQQKLNAQVTSTWWRRIARSDRTWKSAQPSSSLTCLYPCSTQCRIP